MEYALLLYCQPTYIIATAHYPNNYPTLSADSISVLFLAASVLDRHACAPLTKE